MYYCEACRRNAWHLEIWRKDGTGDKIIIPYACRSWRHEGDCRQWCGAQDFERCRIGMEKHTFWLHVRMGFFQRRRRLDYRIFRSGLICWDKMRKRITRKFGPFKYIQTWEAHKSGWPHIHLAVSNATLFHLCTGKPEVDFQVLLGSHAVDCGFGREGWLEPLKSKTAFAGYLTKLANELTGGGKEYQVPVKAPMHFRRLRASVGLLPPRFKNEDMTGMLKRIPMPTDQENSLVPLPIQE